MNSKSCGQPRPGFAQGSGDGKAQPDPPGSAAAPSGVTDIQEAAWK